jgi:hypothetical protein
VTRLIAGTHLAGRLAAASMGVAVIVATGLAAGCSVGQIAETAKIVAAVPGGSASTPVPPNPALKGDVGGTVYVQNVTVDYPGPQGYPAGGTAPLAVRIINQSSATITLKSVSSDAGTVVLTSGAGIVAPAASPSGPASPTATPGSPSATPSPPTVPSEPDVTLQPGGLVILAKGAGQYLEITNLTKALPPGLLVTLRFTFTNTANLPIAPVILGAPVAPPLDAASRSPLGLGG